MLVKRPWAGLMEHQEMDFHPNYSLKILGKDGSERPSLVNIWYWVSSTTFLTSSVLVGVGLSKRGRLVEWVEKTSFVRLNKLFEIIASERNYHSLLFAWNLLVIV